MANSTWHQWAQHRYCPELRLKYLLSSPVFFLLLWHCLPEHRLGIVSQDWEPRWARFSGYRESARGLPGKEGLTSLHTTRIQGTREQDGESQLLESGHWKRCGREGLINSYFKNCQRITKPAHSQILFLKIKNQVILGDYIMPLILSWKDYIEFPSQLKRQILWETRYIQDLGMQITCEI